MKNFIKVIDKDSEGFKYLKTKLPRINDAKLKKGIFVRSKIRELMEDITFKSKMNEEETQLGMLL